MGDNLSLSAARTERHPPTLRTAFVLILSHFVVVLSLNVPNVPQAIPITDNAFWEQIFEAPGDKAEKYYGRTVSVGMP